MQDALHHIGVRRGDLTKHVPGNVGAPVSHAQLVGPQKGFVCDNAGQFQDCPLQVGVLD